MKRKLIKQAGQAITITLPIEWIRQNNLTEGEEIEVFEAEKDLILKSGKKIVGGKIKIDTTGFGGRLKHIYMNSAYARGIDEIEITAEKKYYPELDQNLGYAAVLQKGNVTTVRDISGTTTENLDEIFKRVFQMIIAFYDTAIEDIFESKEDNYQTGKKMDAEVNKFCLFLERAIMKQSYPDQAIGRIIFAYSFCLEKIGDEVLRMWRSHHENKAEKNKNIKEIIMLSREGLQKSFEIYYQQSSAKVEELNRIRDNIRKKTAESFLKDPKNSEFIMHAQKIVEDANDLTHLSLMKKMKEE